MLSAILHQTTQDTLASQLRGLTYGVYSVIVLRRVKISSECVLMVIRFSSNPPFLVMFEYVSLQGFSLLNPKPPELPIPPPVQIFIFPVSLNQSYPHEQSLRNQSAISFQADL